MPLLGQGVLAIWHTITPEGEPEYWRWHDREHIPERVGVPVVASGGVGTLDLPAGVQPRIDPDGWLLVAAADASSGAR